jgi:eukaryotic-like serine/threonine-protein kinase
MTTQQKYRVIRKLAAGGMAEVFIGEAESLQGFTKRVAIKRVLPHLAENQKFLAMFLDEARLSLRFNNANVVQTFDIGRSGTTYFIVMEFVDGTDLKTLCENLRNSGEALPLELALFIIIEACRGLAYAHGMQDRNGEPLHIVHRDVSPPNILLSKQGEVKIVDFGLAKATSQLENTDPGVVKGKFAYLSPEVAFGKSADHRADIFALGIILWELLTGKRLFLGENDYQTVELVRRGYIPSLSELNPKVPPQLEQIVRSALAFESSDRFQGCNDFAEALAGFLFEGGRKVTSFDLQRLVQRVAAEEESKQVAKPSIIDQLIQEEMGRFSSLDDDSLDANEHQRDSHGAIPLDPSGFDADAIDEPTGSGVWRESGLALKDSVADGMLQAPNIPSQHQVEDEEPPSLARMLEGEVRLGSMPPKPVETNSNGMVIGIGIASAIVLVGIFIAVYLLW